MAEKNKIDSLEQLRLRLAEFADKRDGQQFHSPKNLAMALIAETAELVEHFPWLTERQSWALGSEKRYPAEKVRGKALRAEEYE